MWNHAVSFVWYVLDCSWFRFALHFLRLELHSLVGRLLLLLLLWLTLSFGCEQVTVYTFSAEGAVSDTHTHYKIPWNQVSRCRAVRMTHDG